MSNRTFGAWASDPKRRRLILEQAEKINELNRMEPFRIEGLRSQTLRAKEARLRRLALSRGFLIKKLRDSSAALSGLGRYAVVNIAGNDVEWGADSIAEVREWLLHKTL